MKRYVLAAAFLVFFSCSVFDSGRLASVNNRFVHKKHLSAYTSIYEKASGCNDNFDTSILFEMLKNLVFEECAEASGIMLDDTLLKKHYDLMKKGFYGDNLMNALLESDIIQFRNLFVKSFVATNMFIDFVLSDTLNFQKERFSHARKILIGWNFGDKPEKYLDTHIEMILKSFNSDTHDDHEHFDLSDMPVIDSSGGKFLSEDSRYYYVGRKDKEGIAAYRIMKITPDSIITSIAKSFSFRFYDDKYERAIKLLSKDSFWNKVFFSDE